MAFIIDIRRENLNLHLFTRRCSRLSTDRADFVSRLFSRPRPTDLGPTASVEEIFSRYAASRLRASCSSRNAARVRERLLKTRGLPLSQADLAWIDRAFKAFYADGPEIRFWGSPRGRAPAVVPPTDDRRDSPARPAAFSRARKGSGSSRTCSRGT